MQVVEIGNLAQAHEKEDPNLGLVPDTSLPESGLLIEATPEELQALGPVIYSDVIVTAKNHDVNYKQIARLMSSKAFDFNKFTQAIEEVVAEFPDVQTNVAYKTPAVILDMLKKEGLV